MTQLDAKIKSLNLTEMSSVLNVLGNEDAIKLLIAAKEGIKKSTKTIKELGLTQKRYYTRLKELIQIGLIEKNNGVYQLTTLGTICYSLGENFNIALCQSDRLELADKLRHSKSITLEETKQILEALSQKGSVGSLGIVDAIQSLKMIDNYETLVLNIITQIEKAEKNVYIASHYTDSRVIESILRASQRGLHLHILTSSMKKSTEKLQLLRAMFSPKMAQLYSTFLNEKIQIKQAEIPYSFCVVDEKTVFIELPNPSTHAFYVSFSFQSKTLSHKLKRAFEIQYKNAKDDPFLQKIIDDPPQLDQLNNPETLISKYY